MVKSKYPVQTVFFNYFTKFDIFNYSAIIFLHISHSETDRRTWAPLRVINPIISKATCLFWSNLQLLIAPFHA